jgi:cytochrome P450
MAEVAADTVFRPAYPPRRTRPASVPEFLWIAWREPLNMWSRRHFTDLILFGKSPLGTAINVSDPAGIRYVLIENAKNFDKGRIQRKVLGPLMAEGLLLAEGENWKRARRILAPLFTPARTARTAEKMRQIAAARAENWLEDERTSGVVNIDREMTGLTFEIISATMFSDMLGGEAAKFERALSGFLDTAARIDPLDVLDAPNWIPRLGHVFAGGMAKFFETRVAQLVADRRALIESGAPAPDDLMSALLCARDEDSGGKLTEREVASNILTFILAGHETTARALGWTLHLLSRDENAQAQVQAEADAFDLSDPRWAEAVPWTRAVIEEAMRLFPPAPSLARLAKADDVICGQPIPAGTAVLITPYVVHRHQQLWEDPDAFRPERFLPGAREKIDRFAYIPFSQGPRVCIGAAFAMQEAMIALAEVMARYRVDPPGEAEPMPSHRITLRAKHGIRLRVSRRP